MPFWGRQKKYASDSYPQQGHIENYAQLVAGVILFFNLLFLPPVQLLRTSSFLLALLIPLLLTAVFLWFTRCPGGIGFLIVMSFSVFLLAMDIVTLILRLAIGHIPFWWGLLWNGFLPAVLITLGYLAIGYWRACKLYTTHYSLSTKKQLPGGRLRIVQLSDMHPGASLKRKDIPGLAGRIQALNPDMIVLTGDIFDENVDHETFASYCKMLGELHAPYGKWYVYGNHDIKRYWNAPSYTKEDLEEQLKKGDIRILEDESALAGPGEEIRITGRKDWILNGGSRLDARELIPPSPLYTVVLDHEPRDLKDVAATGADLILSGHTHGGQVWPLGWLAHRVMHINEQRYGLDVLPGGCASIVSGGVGTWGYPIRTEGRSEIVCVDITEEG